MGRGSWLVATATAAALAFLRFHFLNRIRHFHKRGGKTARLEQADHELNLFLGEIPRDFKTLVNLRLKDGSREQRAVEYDSQFSLDVVSAQLRMRKRPRC
jgi:hypothetical protein